MVGLQLTVFWLVYLFYCPVEGKYASPYGRPPRQYKNPNGKGMICESIDIRNDVSAFASLTNCTVIEGNLHILLIEGATQQQYQDLHFPDLVEITDYMLLYRVYGLKSLRHIFPNLSVIRGQKLFFNFALVAYEMMDLEELGLIGLTTIERGAVRLEKNPSLCFVDTIDWTKIAVGIQGMEDHYFKSNRNHKECVNSCPSNCTSTAVTNSKDKRKRCWTHNHCQKILECDRSRCRSGICDKGICCNEHCIGGCTGGSQKDCLACKNVINIVNNKTICGKQCMPGTFEYRNRRCLKEEECADMKLKLVRSNKTNMPGQCMLSCPRGYKSSPIEGDYTCIKCAHQCPKVCPGKKVESVRQAQEMAGCTVINGPLEIRINKGSNIGHELEKNLGQIVEVKNHIWIHSSNALLSLNFFKSLRIIRGNALTNGFALLVNDNVNLQELFPEETTNNLQILRGNMVFHYNRKLCVHKILDFQSKVNMTADKSGDDISLNTNGDQMPCKMLHINLTVIRVTPAIAFLLWNKFTYPDERLILSYVINYREAPDKNLSILEGRDACSDDVWSTKDVLNKSGRDEEYVTNLIVNLKAWTQYGVYVQTYTTSSANYGAMSKIVYFRTAPHYPTVPTNLRAIALPNGMLKIMWSPPNEPNGNVTHYEVYWRRRVLKPQVFNQRDYCSEPAFTLAKEKDKYTQPADEKKKTDDELEKPMNTTWQECTCPKSKEQEQKEVEEREMQIKFENYLHNYVYIKRARAADNRMDRKKASNLFKMSLPLKPKKKKTGSRTKRYSREAQIPYNSTEISNITINSRNNSSLDNDSNVNNDTDKELPYFRVIVQTHHFETKDMYYIISNLGHYEDYNIEVIACQERDPRDPKKVKLCSSRALTVARTLADDKADVIESSSVKIYEMKNKSGEVIVNWDEPQNPNGLILTYDIQYSKVLKDVKPNTLCVTHMKYKELRGYKLDKLEPGNYSIQIRATSLAGTTNFTEPKYFMVSSRDTAQKWPQETIIAVSVSGVLLLILIVVIGVWFIARNRFKKIPDTVDFTSINPDYEHYNPDEWEVDRDKIQLIRELGQGSFGMVYEGIARDLYGKGEKIKVAVKTVNEHATHRERMEFLNEASTMKAFSCHHVVRLLGVVSDGQPAFVIMELMAKGDLKNFLRMHRPEEEEVDSTFAGIKENISRTPPTLKRILQMAGEIADGMSYLADKKYVHRDLAARNCMVAEDLTVKIGDFGMTRDIYETDYYRKGGKALLPVRWMAPESLKDGIFTSLSDVWSYGVVLWEMATLAAQPYQGLSNEEVLRYVLNGRVMEKPKGCPDGLFELMEKCWRYRPKQRPTFKEILEMLVPELDPSFATKSYFFSEDNKQDIMEYIEEIDEDGLDESQTPFIQNDNSALKGAEGGMDLNEHEIDDDIDISDEFSFPPPQYHETQHSHHNGEISPSPRIDFVNNILYSRSKADKVKFNGTEPCDCILSQETIHDPDQNHRFSSCSNPYSAIGSSDGSKDSSKSSSSSYAQMNGHIANGHIAMHHLKTTKC